MPAAMCRWGLCPYCPDVGRCLSGVYNHHHCMVYGKYTGGRRGGRIMPNSRAIVLQQGGQCRWARGMIAHEPQSARTSCNGQPVRLKTRVWPCGSVGVALQEIAGHTYTEQTILQTNTDEYPPTHPHTYTWHDTHTHTQFRATCLVAVDTCGGSTTMHTAFHARVGVGVNSGSL